ncbi:hypothetical protein F5X96DRAFT_672343 [Biscogniauxia mediterranea]|nr:hypothetical protein F5X96DRAFT_672343 [Biscogniauxia mediterranea]
MKSFAGVLVAIILALCSGLAVGTSNQNSTAIPSGGSLLVTRPTEASFTTPLAESTNSSNVNVPDPANTSSTYAPTHANVDGAKISAQTTGQQEGLCDFVFGHSCNWFNLRRSHSQESRGIDGHPLTTDWIESTVAVTPLPSSSTDNKLSAGTNSDFNKREDGMGAIPSVDGAYGDHPPDTPSGGYWYPPNPTNQPTITPPAVVTTPISVETRVETVTVSLSYIPPSPLSTSPAPSSLVNSTLVFHNTTVPKTSISSSSQTVTTIDTPTPQTESVSTFIFTPVVDTNAARTTAEVNYPLMCCMVAFVLFGSTTYVIRISSRINSAGNSGIGLHIIEENDWEDRDENRFIEGVDSEEPNTKSQMTTMDFVNLTPKPKYKDDTLAVKC